MEDLSAMRFAFDQIVPRQESVREARTDLGTLPAIPDRDL
jgi:hypothetical protein